MSIGQLIQTESPAPASAPSARADRAGHRGRPSAQGVRGTVAVEDVSFTVLAGEIFGILGRNGAGKTTTVECISGLRTADRGTIRVLGRDPRRDRP